MKKSDIVLAILFILVIIIGVWSMGYNLALIQIEHPGFSLASKGFIVFSWLAGVLFSSISLVIMIKKGGKF